MKTALLLLALIIIIGLAMFSYFATPEEPVEVTIVHYEPGGFLKDSRLIVQFPDGETRYRRNQTYRPIGDTLMARKTSCGRWKEVK
ncbi:unnamed protein product [marine sediment metagenome]|uniref:Uncharacterized protein n=1 Tax=marine sediment metagenome TaxID=412755 RepID=X0SU36_9ZZZZ